MGRDLACGRFSISIPLAVSFLARCCFHGSAEPVKLLGEQGSNKQGKGEHLLCCVFSWVGKEAGCPAMAGKGL